jgi:predicted DNA-binding ribbon-helix-helix protein
MALKKRSVSVAGKKTSISLETEFWDALHELARERSEPLHKIVAAVNADRKSSNLSSTLRVFILQQYRDRAKNVG